MQQALYDICPKFFISGFNCSAPLMAFCLRSRKAERTPAIERPAECAGEGTCSPP
jgi:hypothetical protein